MTPHYADPLVTLYLGDCIDVMREMPEHSVDSVVCDPPYNLSFMGREWDTFPIQRRGMGGTGYESEWAGGVKFSFKPSDLHGFQSWCTEWATEAFRVLKPGGYMIAAGGTRTVHRLASAIEDAGFEIRDMLTWIYASGFPKSLNVSAALRKLPACSCDVPSKVGTVDAGLPAGSVGASVGAEPGAVPLAGLATDEAPGVGAESRPRPGRRSRKVDPGTVDLGGQLDPVVLGPLDVAGAAEGEQIVGSVSGVQADPEPLGDEVVDDEPIGGAAVGAPLVSGEDGVGDDAPASALVAPLAAPPGGVVIPGQTAPVVAGHASSGAVDGLGSGTGNDITAGSTGEGVTHPPDYTTEDQALRCEACGGIRQDRIPEGMGTALKPAFEPWVLARKPLVGTVAANMVRYGTGALNIDGTRIGMSEADREAARVPMGRFVGSNNNRETEGRDGTVYEPSSAGRWPSNVLLSDAELFDDPNPYVVGSGQAITGQVGMVKTEGGHRFIEGDTETVQKFDHGTKDSGGYSRFFLIPKADRAERERGLAGGTSKWSDGRKVTADYPSQRGATERANSHPTVKPIDLMRHLVRLVTPPGGVCLDPFLGSGTTALAASEEGFRCIGIEREAEYLEIAVGRLMATPMGLGLNVPAPVRKRGPIKDGAIGGNGLGSHYDRLGNTKPGVRFRDKPTEEDAA